MHSLQTVQKDHIITELLLSSAPTTMYMFTICIYYQLAGVR